MEEWNYEEDKIPMDGDEDADCCRLFNCFWELVASNPEPRNWRANIISVMVIVFVLVLVSLSVVYMTPKDPGPRVRGAKIELDDILNKKFTPNPHNATWNKDGTGFYYMNHEGALCLFDVKSRKSSEILDTTTFRVFDWQKWLLSDDGKFLLIVHDTIQIYRHSSLAKYTIVSLADRHLPLIKVGVSSTSSVSNSQEYLQHVSMLPTGGLIVIKDNDIFYKPAIKVDTVEQITKTGDPGIIYNGVSDWLYEEEILGSDVAVWPSQSGDKIAYLTFNDSNVAPVVLQHFGLDGKNIDGKTNDQGKTKLRYPKAGRTNPSVTIHVQHLKKSKSVTVQPPTEVTERASTGDQEYYVSSVSWASDDVLSIIFQNRPQNISWYTLCQHPSYMCQVYHTQQRNAWVELIEGRLGTGHPLYNGDLSKMVMIESVAQGNQDLFPHLVHGVVSLTDTIPVTTLTHGNMEVTKIVSWDHTNNWIYYIATVPGHPGVRHLFRVMVNHRNTDNIKCLTCSGHQIFNSTSCVSNLQCTYSEVVMSPNNNAYILHCLGPHVPSSHIFSLPDNRCIKTLDTNEHIRHQLNVSSMPRYKDLSIQLPGTNTPAKVRLTLPPVLRDEEDFIFPLIVNVYGGPSTQTVSSKWSVGWDTYLASQRNFIAASIDVRGTGYQGDSFKHAVYGQLGSHESIDTVHVVHQLVQRIKYIDTDKICVWGWSYGGYLTSRILAEPGAEGLISCGISVSPVTQWHNYDTAYTERYMGLPSHKDNWRGYSRASLTGMASNIGDGRLMLIHGTKDDNVHIEHTMALARILVQNDIIFRQQIYPDEGHGLDGVTKHLYQTMEAFLDDKFGPIHDYFEDDYFLAAAMLVEEYS